MGKSTKKNADGNVDKIRDILLGGVVEQLEGRFKKIEAATAETMTRLELMDKRFEGIEDRLFGEIVALRKQLENRESEIDTALEKSQKQAQEQLKAFQNKESKKTQALEKDIAKGLKAMDAAMAAERKQIRQQLQDQSQSMAKEAERDHRDLKNYLAAERAELTETLLGREELSGVLSELALRITKLSRD